MKHKDQEPIYLSGSHDSDVTTCVNVSEGRTKIIRLLKCAHEEADDRIMYHVNHAVSTCCRCFRRQMYLYRCCTTLSIGLAVEWKNIWVLRGQAVPLHDLLRILNPDVVSILPAAFALTGCYTTRKVGTKKVLHAVESCYGHLQTFGTVVLSDHMICQVEELLLECVSNDKSFNNLRYIVYYKQSFGLDMVKLPTTSESIVIHIKGAY